MSQKVKLSSVFKERQVLARQPGLEKWGKAHQPKQNDCIEKEVKVGHTSLLWGRESAGRMKRKAVSQGRCSWEDRLEAEYKDFRLGAPTGNHR